MGFTFGAARPSETAAIRELLAASSLPTSDLTPGHMEHFFVCRTGSSVVGTVGIEPSGDVALLRSLTVSLACRGNGLATRLLRTMEAHAAGRGVKALYLLTTAAERFFAARGFRVIPRDNAPAAIRATTEFSTLCPSSSVCMTKRLGD